MVGRLRLALLAGALATLATALPPAPSAMAQSLPVRVLDEDRLLNESEVGRHVVERIRDAERALEVENDRIADQLAEEERALTDARAELSPEDFRARADEFDQRVEEIRAERAQRSEELAQFSEAEIQRFFEMAFPVIAELMRDEGVVAILQPDAVIVALETFDITGEAIARLDRARREALEEGGTLEAEGDPTIQPPIEPPSQDDGD